MKQRVLILEASEPLRQSIAFMLDEEGYVPEPVSSVVSAVKHMEQNSVDLLIADLQSSIASGLSLLQPLTGGSTLFPFPAILIHNDLSGAYEITRNLSAGVRFITKPFSRDALMSAVHSFLDVPDEVRHCSEM